MDALIQLRNISGANTAPLMDQLLTAGFRPLVQAPPLAERFVIVDLHDVTEGPFFGYNWQLRAALVVATAASGPWQLNPGTTGDVISDGHEGVAELASITMPHTDFRRVADQVPELADRIRVHYEHTTVPATWRAWNQVARAEWHWRKAEGARQGIWDRLYHEGLLDDMDRDDRARLVEWMLTFGTNPMTLRHEQAAYERATWPITTEREAGE